MSFKHLCAAGLVIAVVAAQAQQPSSNDSTKGQAKPATEANMKTVVKLLTPLTGKMTAMKDKAKGITAEIGKVAASGSLTTSDEAVATLKALVDELSKLNQEMQGLQQQIDEIKGWIEGQNEALPIMAFDIDQLKRFKNGSYLQFQFQDTQNNAGTPRPNDGFAARRARFSHNGVIDARTQYKLSGDFAAGSQRTGFELKDLHLIYDIEPSTDRVGIQLIAGQAPVPLGYELERSSSEREFPERSTYNSRLMAGERNRGAYLKYGLSQHSYIHAGLWDSLTVSDPQLTQANVFRNLSGTKMAAHAGVRYQTPNVDAGVSYYTSYRPGITYATGNPSANVTTDAGQRSFTYLDAAYIINPQWSVRGELMFGTDRSPAFSGSGATLSTVQGFSAKRGSQLQVSYNLNYRNTLSARYEFFDPNDKVDDNVLGYGLAWSYMINPGAKATLAYEIFKEQGIDITNNVTTLRLQFKF